MHTLKHQWFCFSDCGEKVPTMQYSTQLTQRIRENLITTYIIKYNSIHWSIFDKEEHIGILDNRRQPSFLTLCKRGFYLFFFLFPPFLNFLVLWSSSRTTSSVAILTLLFLEGKGKSSLAARQKNHSFLYSITLITKSDIPINCVRSLDFEPELWKWY